MGLDMYLYAEKFLSGHDWNPEEEKEKVRKLAADAGVTLAKNAPFVEIRFTIGSWRKANAIHRWFVDTCGDGADDCRPVYVSRENLENLLDLCNQVKEDNERAPELLPTQEGFFFGSTDYNQWYFRDIDKTIEILEYAQTLRDLPFSFYYQASW